jgi:hypothetical protein
LWTITSTPATTAGTVIDESAKAENRTTPGVVVVDDRDADQR